MKKRKSWKNRQGIVYSTNPDFGYTYTDQITVAPHKAHQKIRVSLDKKNRGGKQVTLVSGFSGTGVQLKELAKLLKSKCGVGGSAKDGEIIIQGNFIGKISAILESEGFRVSG